MSLTLKLALGPLLVAQAVATRARLPRLPEAGGARRGETGHGPLLRLLIAGIGAAIIVGAVVFSKKQKVSMGAETSVL